MLNRPFEYDPPLSPALNILYHDEDILILDKPVGLLTVPGKDPNHADCLEARAKEKFSEAKIVHRLDMDTSGLIVLGKNKVAHRHLSLQFQNRNVKKAYEALVFGIPSDKSGIIDLPLICDWPNRPKQMVDHENGKKSITEWNLIDQHLDISRIHLIPMTGRSHQLRVHMLSLGHPILGDRFYAPDKAYKMKERLCLHSKQLTIMHPVKKEKMTFDSIVPF